MIRAFSCATLARSSIHTGMPPAASALTPLLARARCPTIGDNAHINTAVMGANECRGKAGPLGEHISADKDLLSRGVDSTDGKRGAVLFRRETDHNVLRPNPAEISGVVRTPSAQPSSSIIRH